MKKLLFLATVLLAVATPARATIEWNSSTLNLDITDGNAVGVFNTYTLASSGTLNTVQVSYSLTGGRAGDLLGYLILNDAGTTYSTALINRPGVGGGNVFGDSADTSSLSVSAPGADVTVAMGVGSLNLGANSTWTLYLADLAAGGGTSQLTSWGLSFDITAVPEPATWALLIFGVVAGGTMLARRVRRQPA
jgi:hypothetical protein